ncbi:unnamed protein product, partial [Hapterophycus canaliculatus]
EPGPQPGEPGPRRGSNAEEDRHRSRLPSPSPSSSISSWPSSRRELVSEALRLGAVGAGAILARPYAAAAAAASAPPSTRPSSPSAALLQDSRYVQGDRLAGQFIAPSGGRSGLLLPHVGARTKRIFLARHGQTDLNKLEVCQGRKLNPPLNEKGRGQARTLLAGTDLGAIVCSPLRRARETAGIVLERWAS